MGLTESEELLGLLKVRVIRGYNLAIRDFRSSDPYVIIKMNKYLKIIRGVKLAQRDRRSSDPYVVVRLDTHKLKTRVVKKNVNPVWNEDLTLSISDPTHPIRIEVYDKDTFSFDDPMGNAEIDIQPFMEAVKLASLQNNIANNTIMKKVLAGRHNCLAEESPIYFFDGKIVEDMILRLRNVESGELEIQLKWINVPMARKGKKT